MDFAIIHGCSTHYMLSLSIHWLKIKLNPFYFKQRSTLPHNIQFHAIWISLQAQCNQAFSSFTTKGWRRQNVWFMTRAIYATAFATTMPNQHRYALIGFLQLASRSPAHTTPVLTGLCMLIKLVCYIVPLVLLLQKGKQVRCLPALRRPLMYEPKSEND